MNIFATASTDKKLIVYQKYVIDLKKILGV